MKFIESYSVLSSEYGKRTIYCPPFKFFWRDNMKIIRISYPFGITYVPFIKCIGLFKRLPNKEDVQSVGVFTVIEK